MAAFEPTNSSPFYPEFRPLTTPPRSGSPVVSIWDRFQQLCLQDAEKVIYLHMTVLVRSREKFSRARSSELKVKFGISEPSPVKEGKVDNIFFLSMAPKFTADPPCMTLKIKEKIWKFKIQEAVDEEGNIGLKLVSDFENPIIDDMTGRFHLIKGKYELLLHPFFVGGEDPVN